MKCYDNTRKKHTPLWKKTIIKGGISMNITFEQLLILGGMVVLLELVTGIIDVYMDKKYNLDTVEPDEEIFN